MGYEYWLSRCQLQDGNLALADCKQAAVGLAVVVRETFVLLEEGLLLLWECTKLMEAGQVQLSSDERSLWPEAVRGLVIENVDGVLESRPSRGIFDQPEMAGRYRPNSADMLVDCIFLHPSIQRR